jgi:hypothetical protein
MNTHNFEGSVSPSFLIPIGLCNNELESINYTHFNDRKSLGSHQALESNLRSHLPPNFTPIEYINNDATPTSTISSTNELSLAIPPYNDQSILKMDDP